MHMLLIVSGAHSLYRTRHGIEPERWCKMYISNVNRRIRNFDHVGNWRPTVGDVVTLQLWYKDTCMQWLFILLLLLPSPPNPLAPYSP